jgi:hypothetical protein
VGLRNHLCGKLASVNLALACSGRLAFCLNPAGHHLHNVLIHALSAVLLFLLLVGVTKRVAPLWRSTYCDEAFSPNSSKLASTPVTSLAYLLSAWDNCRKRFNASS